MRMESERVRVTPPVFYVEGHALEVVKIVGEAERKEDFLAGGYWDAVNAL
ncbi:MAG TPA: hypothetical protein VGU46_11205 [Acidobacteriaceae bacterium]|nr:hypothetical protein [Acidobacteriaceae bacterium]